MSRASTIAIAAGVAAALARITPLQWQFYAIFALVALIAAYEAHEETKQQGGKK